MVVLTLGFLTQLNKKQPKTVDADHQHLSHDCRFFFGGGHQTWWWCQIWVSFRAIPRKGLLKSGSPERGSPQRVWIFQAASGRNETAQNSRINPLRAAKSSLRKGGTATCSDFFGGGGGGLPTNLILGFLEKVECPFGEGNQMTTSPGVAYLRQARVYVYIYESTSELSKTTLSTAFHSILVFCIFLGER